MATPKIEANIAGTWTDVTADDLPASFLPVRRRVRTGVQITRGRQDQQSAVSPGTMSFELNNQDGKYSTRNMLSDYFGMLGRNTPIRVGVDPMSDTFTRTVVDGWGTSSSGHAWTIAAGTAANFDVGGSAGTIVTSSTALQAAMLPLSYGEVDVRCKVRFSSVANNAEAGITLRQDSGHYVRLAIAAQFPSSPLRLVRSNAPDFATLATGTGTISASTDYMLAFSIGKRLRGKFWAANTAEPDDWGIDFLDDQPGFVGPAALEKHGPVGLYALTSSGSTPTTVTFDDLVVVSYRFHGEVKSWPSRWDKSEADVSVPVEAVGILDRLTTNTQASLQSPMFREATKESVTDFIAAYWPCEDGSNATQLASALPDASPITFVGPVNGAQSTGIPGSKPLAVFGTAGNISGYVTSRADTTGAVYFRIILDVPDSPTTADGSNILNLYLTGSFPRCALIYNTASSGSLEARAVSDTGTTLESASLGGSLNGTRLYLSIELVQSGSNISFLAARNEIQDDDNSVTSSVFADTWASMTVGSCYRITAGSMEGWGFGHIGVGNDQEFMFSMASALIGNSGETAGNRAIRVADEAGLALQIVGDPDDSALMGPQIQGAALDVLRSCEAADGGIMYESRNELGLTLRLLSSMVNQTGPTLDYDVKQVNTIEPDDEQDIFNDVTVSRLNGSSSHASLDTGALSTREPPDGAGRLIAPELVLAVRYDSQLRDRAWWQNHLYTWDEQRFRLLGVQHGAPALQADADLRAEIAALDTGDMLAVDNPPAWLPPDQIRQLVQGYTEVIAPGGASKLWSIDWNTTPYRPYQVGEWGSATDPDSTDTESRYDTANSELASTITSGATSMSVTTNSGPLWTTDADDFPMDVRLGPSGGEVVQVTNITGSSSPQTFTIVRGQNGVSRSWTAFTDVGLAEPAYWAL